MRRRALALALLGVLASGGVVWALPAVAAFACPACYGFDRLGPGLWVHGGTAEGRAALLHDTGAAQARVAAFWGMAPKVAVLACLDQPCADRLDVRKARGMAYGGAFLVVTPRGLGTPTFLAHEMNHIAFHRRIGPLAQVRGAVPAWFDEGLAIIVSQDARAPAAWGQPCPRAAATLPASPRQWRHDAAKPGANLYGAAACRVGRWLAGNGGKPGLMKAIGSIRNGGALPL